MPRLALHELNIMEPDMHRTMAAVEVAGLVYFAQRPPLRFVRNLSPFQRALVCGAVFYAYETYLNVKSTPASSGTATRIVQG